jgi:hypothetical protein
MNRHKIDTKYPPFGAASAALAAISSVVLNGLICAAVASRFSGCPVLA